MENLIKQESELVLAEIKKAIVALQSAEKDLAPAANRLMAVEVTEAGLSNAKGQLKLGKQTRKLFADARMEVTRPLDDLKKQIMLFESDSAKAIDDQIVRVEGGVKDVEADMRRKELAAKAEEERIAKEKAEAAQKEEERKRNILNRITALSQRWNQAIAGAQTQDDCINVLNEIEALNLFDFHEFANDMTNVADYVRLTVTSKRVYLADMAQQLAKQQKLAEENQKAAADLAAFNMEAEKQKQEAEAEARKLQEERDALAREVENARIAAENAARQKAAQEAEDARKELEAQIRQKAINAGFDVFVTNISIVPQGIYEIKWKINEIKEMLRDGKVIPGIRILSKDTDNTSIQ